MSTLTKNYQFIKPDLTDPADIRTINENFDKLDDMIFRSGEVGNHIADPNAHSEIFANYLPLSGGTMTGSVYGRYSEWSQNVKFGGSMIFDSTKTGRILGSGVSNKGATIEFYGSDITSGYTSRKDYLWLKSTDSTNSNHSCSLYISPDGVTISDNNRTGKFALNTSTIGVSTMFAKANDLPCISSYNGACTMQFKDLGSTQFIRLTVGDNNIDVKPDGVYYNDMPSIYVVDTQITTGKLTTSYGKGEGNYYCRMTKYVTGLLIYELKTWATTKSEFLSCDFTYPIPFVDTDYVVAGSSVRRDKSDTTYSDYVNQTWNATTTGITISCGGGDCDQRYIIRGRWK